MALGFLHREYRSEVVAYDDEATPIGLIGKKMLPIANVNGQVMGESLDIIKAIDTNNKLQTTDVTTHPEYKIFEKVLEELGSPVHSLAMPYWIYTPEFNENSREYFKKKKEVKRGPFKELLKNQKQYVDEMNQKLATVAKDLKPFYQSQEFGLKDILIASHIWGLYVVPEFQFEPKVHEYLQRVKAICQFQYHQPYWESL